jgi:hypothetical protein
MTLPLFEAARSQAFAKLRTAPKGQRRKCRKALQDATTAALKEQVRK